MLDVDCLRDLDQSEKDQGMSCVNPERPAVSLDLLVCPETKRQLQLVTLAEAERLAGTEFIPRAEAGGPKGLISHPLGRTRWVLLRDDRECVYPVWKGIPVLLVPEALRPRDAQRDIDLTLDRYAEAYAEMPFYNEVGEREALSISSSTAYNNIEPALHACQSDRDSFPAPRHRWIEAVYDCQAEWDAYQHLAPLRGHRILQLGGKGTHAVKFLLAGASEGWVLTPMWGEALCSEALAAVVGVADRLRTVVAVAEELPFRDATMDGIFSPACLHHMVIDAALREAARVLRLGGKFATFDPWKAPLYRVGTAVFGRREPGDSVCDVPLTRDRLDALWSVFKEARIVQHATISRYALLALSKLGVKTSLETAWHCGRVDDALCSLLPGMRGMGSSVAVLGTKC